MTPQELVYEINQSLESTLPQTEENLYYMQKAIVAMFEANCGQVPNFEFINSKGQIKLIKPEL